MENKITEKINVNLHGHGLPDYGYKWKRRLGYDDFENTAEIIFNRCVEENINIYTLTNEPEFPGFMIKSRYECVRDSAIDLSSNKKYELSSLGKNAFHLKKSDNGKSNEIIFLNGQSLRIKDNELGTGREREYELLTFGKSGIPNFNSFSEAFKYLNGEGLPAIGEHLLAYGHHGPMEIERIKDYCENKNFLAVEHNGKIAMPNLFYFLPPIDCLKIVRGATKNKNKILEKLVNPYGIPIIGNDDADFPNQIGSAYTEFTKNKLRLDKDENIGEDLINLIKSKDFIAHKGNISTLKVLEYALLISLP